MSNPKRLLFVCLGNIVRSPLAEHLFLRRAAEAGLDGKYAAESAGIANWHEGEEPDPRMRRIAAARGLVYTGSARQFRIRDFPRYDLILGMDTENRAALLALARSDDDREKIHLLREFDPQAPSDASVPDPYYDGINSFEDTYQIIDRSIQGLLEALERGQV